MAGVHREHQVGAFARQQQSRLPTFSQAVHVLHVQNPQSIWSHTANPERICFLCVEPACMCNAAHGATKVQRCNHLSIAARLLLQALQ